MIIMLFTFNFFDWWKYYWLDDYITLYYQIWDNALFQVEYKYVQNSLIYSILNISFKLKYMFDT